MTYDYLDKALNIETCRRLEGTLVAVIAKFD